MKLTLDHTVEDSIYLWLDHVFAAEGQGFSNYTGQFVSTSPSIVGTYAYAAPHRQFVYDYSVAGANIISGVNVNNVFTPKGTGTAPRIDYTRGQVLFFTDQGNANISGAYAYKQVNTYIVNKPEYQILFEKKFDDNPRLGPSFTGYQPNDSVMPAVLIQTDFGKNTTLDFAGLSESIFPIRLTVLADSPSLLKSICGILRDKQETHMALFNPSDTPLTKFGDTKFPFNYALAAQAIQQDNPNRLAFLQRVRISPFTSRMNSLMGLNTFAAFVDIDCLVVRFPRG